MNKAKKYYVDNDGNMIGYTRYHRNEKIEKQPEMFHAKLQIKRVGWLNSGFYFILEDESGKEYYMNDVLFRKYLEKGRTWPAGLSEMSVLPCRRADRWKRSDSAAR